MGEGHSFGYRVCHPVGCIYDIACYIQMVGGDMMTDCNKCVWARRDGGCNAWDCEFIDQDEAVKAFKDKRKTGRWIVKRDTITGATYGECTSCGMRQYAGHTRYCPDCGSLNKPNKSSEGGE